MTTETQAWPFEPGARTIDDAAEVHLTHQAVALTFGTWMCGVCAALMVVIAGLIWMNLQMAASVANVKPVIVRIDEVGRAEVVAYDVTTWTMRQPELEHFLTNFATLHYSRRRATIHQTFPQSLFFMSDALGHAARDSLTVESFLADPTLDEIEIDVTKVSFQELTTPPYRAAIDFEQVQLMPGSRRERSRRLHTAQVEFSVRDRVDSAFYPVNPLGLQVTHVRVAQAFRDMPPPDDARAQLTP